MSGAEPDGCWHQWESLLHYTGHTCIEDANHDGPHVCGCGEELDTPPSMTEPEPGGEG